MLTTRLIQSHIIYNKCTVVLFTLLMFLASLCSVTPDISMYRNRDEILSPRQHSLSFSVTDIA